MNWYYAENNQQKGPFSEVEMAGFVTAGAVTDQTLVWHEGLTQWLPYREVMAAAVPSPTAPPAAVAAPTVAAPQAGEAVCAECGRIFPLDQTVPLGAVRVCSGCKPIFIQKLREGVAPTQRRGRRSLPVDPDQLTQEILSRGVEVNVGGCVSRAWQLVTRNLGLTVGTTLLVTICMQAAGVIPFVGACISLLFYGPLMGGLYWFFLKLIRGDGASVGDGFAGFSSRFGSLLAVFLLMCLFIYLPFAPFGIYAVATGQFDRSLPDAICIGLGLAGLLVAMFLGIALTQAVPLVMDLELGPWSALQVSRRVVCRRWFSFLLLGLVCGCIVLLGFLALCVGVLVAMPVTYAIWMYAYDDIFGAGTEGGAA